MGKHTPGPWYVSSEGSADRHRANAIYRVGNENRYPTADEATANEALIAHAPDLLALLKEAAYYVGSPEYNLTLQKNIGKLISKVEGPNEG